jgi:HK97 family phage portal protein
MSWNNPFRRKPKAKGYADTDQGWMNTSWDPGWWQQDLKPLNLSSVNEVVEACISALSQTAAMLPIYQYRELPKGGEERLNGSKAERVLLNPNSYSTRSQFFNTLIRSMYFEGNGYAIASRDGNGAIDKLYAVEPKTITPVLDQETGELYYWASPSFGKGFNSDTDMVHLARDVLHLRINVDPKDPLKGLTPLSAAAASVAASNAINNSQAAFFNNMSRPSGSLYTDKDLTADQMNQLREAIHNQSQGRNIGKVPIYGSGLKWQSQSLSSQDSQMVEAANMSVESISRVFRVPLPLINSLQGSTFNNAEAMGRWFLASGLGFLLEHIELELGKLFAVPFTDRINFDTKMLLRSDWQTQISTLGEGVLKGIYSPNEARAILRLKPVADGDGPRVQQQVVPLSAWDMEAAPPDPAPAPSEPEIEAALREGVTKGLANVG